MDGIIIWTRKSYEKLQNAIFFKIFKIPSNGQLVYVGLEPNQIFFKKKF